MPPESPRESVPEDEVEVVRSIVADCLLSHGLYVAEDDFVANSLAIAKEVVAALTTHRAARGWVVVPAEAERLIATARARFEVWTRETYVEMDEALKAYDRAMVQSGLSASRLPVSVGRAPLAL